MATSRALFTRRRLADRLADQLLLSQFVVHQKPPREPHSFPWRGHGVYGPERE